MMKKLTVVLGVVLVVGVIGAQIYFRQLRAQVKEDPRTALMIEASADLVARVRAGTLPGVAADEHGDLHPVQELPIHGEAPVYPCEVVFNLDKTTGTDHHLRYTLRKAEAKSSWELVRAERLNAEGSGEPLAMTP